jgi:hypothetical protein
MPGMAETLARPADVTFLPWRRCRARHRELRCRRRHHAAGNHWSQKRGDRASWFWDDSSG